MRKSFTQSVIAASILALAPHALQAQITERHQQLMSMPLQDIIREAEKGAIDYAATGHVFFRCAIVFSVAGAVVAAAVPQDASESMREDVEELRARYEARSTQMINGGIQMLDLPEGQIKELFKEMNGAWVPVLRDGGAQMFLTKEEDRGKDPAAQDFMQQLKICTVTSDNF